MARIRTIKPEFFTSEDIVSLSPLARILYIAIWCESDKEGRMNWKPRTFKMRYMPADECSIDDLCAEIVGAGLVVLYGDGLAYIPTFKTHQHINPRETDSILPSPDEIDASSTRQARVGVASVTRREEGKEGKERNTRAASCDTDIAFQAFWSAFPNKKAKQDAFKAWSKLKPCDALQASILKAVEIQRQGEEWRKEDGRFIPHAATWINGKRWEDSQTVTGQSSLGYFGKVI
jgi:hypothetical protein